MDAGAGQAEIRAAFSSSNMSFLRNIAGQAEIIKKFHLLLELSKDLSGSSGKLSILP